MYFGINKSTFFIPPSHTFQEIPCEIEEKGEEEGFSDDEDEEDEDCVERYENIDGLRCYIGFRGKM